MIGPRSMDPGSGAVDLQHRPSAKQLISRYESLDYRAPQARRTSIQARISSIHKPSLSISERSVKLPVRESFRNIVGFFKKANSRFGVKKGHSVDPSKRDSSEAPSASIDSLDSVNNNAKMCGSLLYLSRPRVPPLSSPILPVWTNCGVSLESKDLILSWSTLQGAPDGQSISLHDCTDVRSITVNQLDSDEKALLPQYDQSKEPKFFEVIFVDNYKELFAAASVSERADWVRAIWDSVLLPRTSQDKPITGASDMASSKHRSLPPVPLASPTPVSAGGDSRLYQLDQSAHFSGKDLYQETLDTRTPQADATPCFSASQYSPSNFSLTTRNASPPLNSRLLPTIPDVRSPASTHTALEDSILQFYADPDLTQATQVLPARPPPSMIPTMDSELLAAPRVPALKQSENPQGLLDQLASFQADLQNLGPPATQAFTNMHSLVASVDDRTRTTASIVNTIRAKLEELSQSIPSSAKTEDTTSTPRDMPQIGELSKTLDTIQTLLQANMPVIQKTLQDLSEKSSTPQDDIHVMRNVGRSATPSEPSLDEKISAVVNSSAAQADHLTEILSLVKEETQHRAQQSQQQADSVRYLNELNNWLEAFVNNGTSQIQAMATSIDRLSNDLGVGAVPESMNNEGRPASAFQTLVQEVRAHHQDYAVLKQTMEGLIQGFDSQSVAALVDRQRQEHEHLVRTLTSEITGEIRGERLRFVDAMKEATAINVQIHVEEFKKELKKEVRGMTEELARLHQERQTMESQIAELFSFYSKQRDNMMAPQQNHGPPQSQYSMYPAAAFPGGKRPLPNPSPQRRGSAISR